jgi:hypothetical protein
MKHSEQERTDFAPIEAVFPLAILKNHKPLIILMVQDALGLKRPAELRFDGTLVLEGAGPISLDIDILATLQHDLTKAADLYTQWLNSPSGQAMMLEATL